MSTPHARFAALALGSFLLGGGVAAFARGGAAAAKPAAKSADVAAPPSAVVASPAERGAPRDAAALGAKGFAAVTTEIADAPPFYYAENYHQQYLAKNPGGYCGLGGTGVTCPGS